MSRKFIALVSAAAIAVAGFSASEAHADKRTRNVILGAAALAILGAAVSADRNDDRGAHIGTRNHPRPRGGHHNGNAYGHGHGYGNGHAHGNPRPRGPRAGIDPRPVPGRVFLSELPRRCLITVKRGRNVSQVYENRCLSRNYSYMRHLPKNCQTTIRANGRRISGYDAACTRSSFLALNRR